MGRQAGRVMPSDRELHRLALKSSPGSVTATFCVWGGLPVLRVDSGIFLIQRKKSQVSLHHPYPHTTNGTANGTDMKKQGPGKDY